MAQNILLKIQLHSIDREKLAMLKQFPSLTFHFAEFYKRKIFNAVKYEPNKDN
jgi:hypothetical protein